MALSAANAATNERGKGESAHPFNLGPHFDMDSGYLDWMVRKMTDLPVGQPCADMFAGSHPQTSILAVSIDGKRCGAPRQRGTVHQLPCRR